MENAQKWLQWDTECPQNTYYGNLSTFPLSPFPLANCRRAERNQKFSLALNKGWQQSRGLHPSVLTGSHPHGAKQIINRIWSHLLWPQLALIVL